MFGTDPTARGVTLPHCALLPPPPAGCFPPGRGLQTAVSASAPAHRDTSLHGPRLGHGRLLGGTEKQPRYRAVSLREQHLACLHPHLSGKPSRQRGPGVLCQGQPQRGDTHPQLPSASSSREKTDMEPFQLDINHLQQLDTRDREEEGIRLAPGRTGAPGAEQPGSASRVSRGEAGTGPSPPARCRRRACPGISSQRAATPSAGGLFSNKV